MDLDLDILPPARTRGRAPAVIEAEVTRELSLADLALLSVEKGSTAPNIKSLRESHHALARSLASGVKPAEASIITGYSTSRISILQADPAFKELVQFYRENANLAYADLHERMGVLALDAAETLLERLNDDPDSMSSGFLLDLMKTLADRTGHGPQTKSTNVNVNINLASRLEAARRRSGLVALPERRDD